MPDIADIQPFAPGSDAERQAQAVLGDAQRSSFTEALDAALADNRPSMIARQIASSGFAVDPAYRLDDKKLKELSDGIDPDLRSNFATAVSDLHAQQIRNEALNLTERRRTLANAGFAGLALKAAADIMDPVAIAAGLATGGLGTAGKLAGTAGRVGSMVRAGLVAGAPFAALEGYRASQDPSVTATDIVRAGLTSFAFGAGSVAAQDLGRLGKAAIVGGTTAAASAGVDTVAGIAQDRDFGRDLLFNAATQLIFNGSLAALHGAPEGVAVTETPLVEASRRAVKDVQFADLGGKVENLSPKGQAYFAEQINPDTAAARFRDVISKYTDDTSFIVSIDKAETPVVTPRPETPFVDPKFEGSVGAATPTEIQSKVDAAAAKQTVIDNALAKKTPFDLDLSHVTDSPPIMTSLGPVPIRFDMGALSGQSDVPRIRKAANMMGIDPLPKQDGSAVAMSTSEWVEATHDSIMAPFLVANDKAFGDHVRAAKQSGAAPLTREAWAEEVGKAVRRPAGTYTSDPTINAAADRTRALAAESLNTAKRHGVNGFDEIDPRDTYLTRLGNRNGIDANLEKFGIERVTKGVAAAIQAGSEDLSPELAQKMAAAWIKNIGVKDNRSPLVRGRMFAADQAEQLTQVLKEVGIDDSTIQDILYATKKKPGDGGVPTRARRRIGMDETMVVDMGNGETMAMESMLENNAETIAKLYNRQMLGQSALAEVYRNLSNGPDETITTIDQMLHRLESDARAQNASPKDIKWNLKRIETLAKITGGIPLYEDTATTRTLRAIRGMNFMRVMSGVGSGIQNFSELSESISENGARAMLKQIPALGKLFARDASGNLSGQLAREMEVLTGLGNDRITRRIMPRAGQDGESLTSMNNAEHLIARGQRLASDLSLQSVGSTTLHRVNGELIAQKWYDVAKSGKPMSEKRAAALGLSQEKIAKVNSQILTHATVEKGVTGARVSRLNIHEWTDPEAVSLFRSAVSRQARQLILTNSPAAYARWMTTPMGQVMAQLRTFSFGAWTQKTLYNVHMRDFQAFKSTAFATVAAAASYAVRTYYDSIGKPDRQKFLDDRLAPDKVLKAGFSRAAYSSMIPMAVDSVAHDMLRRPTIFSYSRSSGLDGGLFANPTFDWANNVKMLPSAVFGPLASDYQFSREDASTIKNSLYVPNLFGINNIIEQMTQNLPRKSIDQRGSR